MTKDLLLIAIKQRDSLNPITSKQLESNLYIEGPQIRDWVREMRREGVPIGSDRKGYYICKTPSELIHTLADLKSRSLSMLETISALQNTLKEMKGQDRLI